MARARLDDVRSRALDAFLTKREAEGFRVETRMAMQAVISRPHSVHFLLRLIARGSAQRRLISVDQGAQITSVAVEPGK